MLWLAMAFAAGFLTAMIYVDAQRKRRQKRREQRKRASRERLRSNPAALPQGEPAAQKPKVSRGSSQMPKLSESAQFISPSSQKAAPSKPEQKPKVSQKPETDEERIQRIYKDFTPMESLELKFEYAFPETALFQPGSGYLRNAKNEAMPNQQAVTAVNSAVGYAMEGLFWAYDVSYHGKTYTYHQILEGQMGNAYVQIRDVAAPAVLAPTGHFGSYKLKKRGFLRVVDIQ